MANNIENSNNKDAPANITIDLKNVNLQTIIEIFNRVDLNKLAEAFALLGLKNPMEEKAEENSTDTSEEKDTVEELTKNEEDTPVVVRVAQDEDYLLKEPVIGSDEYTAVQKNNGNLSVKSDKNSNVNPIKTVKSLTNSIKNTDRATTNSAMPNNSMQMRKALKRSLYGSNDGRTFNKRLEVLNAIKPMLDYERYTLLDRIIKIYSLSQFL